MKNEDRESRRTAWGLISMQQAEGGEDEALPSVSEEFEGQEELVLDRAGTAPSLVSGLAVASFVLGLLWVAWIGSLLAVILGHAALKETRTGARGGHGLAVAGLTLGYLGLGVFLYILLVLVLGTPGGMG